MEYTKGEWKVETVENGLQNIRAECGTPIAKIGVANNDKEETANAQLISAAPELYEALKDVRLLLRLEPLKDCENEPWALRVIEALAKAEGN